MVVLSCPITDCGFKTDDVDLVGAATILSVYAHAHTIPHPNATPVTLLSGPKLVRPRILYNVEVWNAFLRRWDTFRVGSGITDAAAPGQLLECNSESLCKKAPSKILDHQIFSKGQWRQTQLTGHPKVTIGLALETLPCIEVTAVAGTGAQSNLWSNLLAEFDRKERIIDDTIFYDENLEEHWWRVPYWQYRHSLYVTDGVIIYNDGVVTSSTQHIKAPLQWVYELGL